MSKAYGVSTCRTIAAQVAGFGATRTTEVFGGTYADLRDDAVADFKLLNDFPGCTGHDFFFHREDRPCSMGMSESSFNRQQSNAPTQFLLCKKSSTTIPIVIDLASYEDELSIEPKAEPLPIEINTCAAESNANAPKVDVLHRSTTVIRGLERSKSVQMPAEETYLQAVDSAEGIQVTNATSSARKAAESSRGTHQTEACSHNTVAASSSRTSGACGVESDEESQIVIWSARTTPHLNLPQSSSQARHSEYEEDSERHSNSATDLSIRRPGISQERRLQRFIEQINGSKTPPKWNLTLEVFHRQFPPYGNAEENQPKRKCGEALRTFHDTTPGVDMEHTFRCIHVAYEERINQQSWNGHPPQRSWLPQDFKKGCEKAKDAMGEVGGLHLKTKRPEENLAEAYEDRSAKRRRLTHVEIEGRKARNGSTASPEVLLFSTHDVPSTAPSSFGKIPSAQPSHSVPEEFEEQYQEAPQSVKLALTRLFQSRWVQQGLSLEELYNRFRERIFESRDLVENITTFCAEALSLSFKEAFKFMRQGKADNVLREGRGRLYWEPRDVKLGMRLALGLRERIPEDPNRDVASEVPSSPESFDGTIHPRLSLM